ncbi:nucleoside-diphosphate-sugar epimerase [Lasiosphaeria ovina]|uniref:Nucleoside-diphosphate-sugar epimerase n=1 Tax=Lasiosphaeria ovina TaxID=92902 RepID=A0AAE0JSZ8_9PEZI|nr:nucleoside-diphosphate-sugar epimerase [Lasiosphaeria ovina]
MHLILAGATGLVGSAVLDAMLKISDVTRISILSRRSVPMAEAANDARINVIIHTDFSSYDSSVLQKLGDADGCVWALGISQTLVGKEEYIKITKDYAVAAAEAFQNIPSTTKKPFNFVYVSGRGATFTPGLMTPLYGRVKGETELLLAEMRRKNPDFRAATVRPAWVDDADHAAIKPYIPGDKGFVLRSITVGVLGPVVRVANKASWSPTGPLGVLLTEMAMGRFDDEQACAGKGYHTLDGGFKVVDNVGMRRLGGWDEKK